VPAKPGRLHPQGSRGLRLKNERRFHLREIPCSRSNRSRSESHKSSANQRRKKKRIGKRTLNSIYSATSRADGRGYACRVKCVREDRNPSRNWLAQPALFFVSSFSLPSLLYTRCTFRVMYTMRMIRLRGRPHYARFVVIRAFLFVKKSLAN